MTIRKLIEDFEEIGVSFKPEVEQIAEELSSWEKDASAFRARLNGKEPETVEECKEFLALRARWMSIGARIMRGYHAGTA
jgi:hypothetical protein